MAAGADDAFLDLRHAFGRHFHAQVATGHHDRIRKLRDGLQLFDCRWLLDLRHQVGTVTDQLACFGDVFGALHERQGHPVHAQLQAEGQVAAVFLGERGEVEYRLRHVDTLAIGQLATGQYFGVDGVAVLGGDAQAQLAVVQQQVHARLKGGDDLGVRQVDPAAVARGVVQVQAQGLAALQLHLAVGKAADAQLRPLQVHEDTQRVVQLLLDFADPLVAQGVVGVLAVAEVEAEDVHPGFYQLADVVDAFDRRAKGGEDFDFFIRRHDWAVSRIRMARKSLTLVRVGSVTIRASSAAK
ncbi:hypothetical protein D3C78_1045210 [compost metagenome]